METKKSKPVGNQSVKHKRTVRRVAPGRSVTIDDILAQTDARSYIERLVKDRFPEDLLKTMLVAFANGSAKRIDPIPGKSRGRVRDMAKRALKLADEIEVANKSQYIDPEAIHYPPDPWYGHDMPLEQKFLKLPTVLRLYHDHIQFCLDRLPRTVFNSDRQELKLALILMAERFTERKHYEEVAELLTSADRAAAEVMDNSTENDKDSVITAGRLAQQFRRNKWCMERIRKQLEAVLSPATDVSTS